MEYLVKEMAPIIGVREENIPSRLYFGLDDCKIFRQDFHPAFVDYAVEPDKDNIGKNWYDVPLVESFSDIWFYVCENILYTSKELYYTVMGHELQHIKQLQSYCDDLGDFNSSLKQFFRDYCMNSSLFESEANEVGIEACNYMLGTSYKFETYNLHLVECCFVLKNQARS
jgi:hypothetical protein